MLSPELVVSLRLTKNYEEVAGGRGLLRIRPSITARRSVGTVVLRPPVPPHIVPSRNPPMRPFLHP